MEQALTHHYGELKALPMYNTRMVVENEEVEKSQVILAAQEMVDSLQKMVEQVSDMLVKELPAVVDGVNSEVGTDQGQQFNTAVSGALSSLQGALTQAKAGIQGGLGIITGQGGGMADMGMDADMGLGDESMADMGMDDIEDLDGVGADEELPELPTEPDEDETVAGVGRSVR